jgi:hypothetical protein
MRFASAICDVTFMPHNKPLKLTVGKRGLPMPSSLCSSASA